MQQVDSEVTGARLVRVVSAASASVVVGSLPVFLLGALAVLVREDVSLTESHLGLATGVFFTCAALTALPAGRATARFGPWATTTLAGCLSSAAMTVMAMARSYTTMVLAIALAGAAAAFATIGSNGALAGAVPRRQQGLAFGLKQAAVPGSTLLAGLAVPAIGLTVGWRAAFASGAVLGLAHVALAPRPRPGSRRPLGPARAAARGPLRPLLLVSVAAAIGGAAATAAGTFLVASAVDAGISLGRAGLLLALGSAVGVVVRVGVGWFADRSGGDPFLVVAALLGAGAVGGGLAATADPLLLVPGSVLAIGLGWGWPGLLNVAVVRLDPQGGAAGTGMTQTGIYAGGALGPGCFGLAVHAGSYPLAWALVTAAMLVAAALMAYGRGAASQYRALPQVAS